MGRPRQYASNADRLRAWRERQREMKRNETKHDGPVQTVPETKLETEPSLAEPDDDKRWAMMYPQFSRPVQTTPGRDYWAELTELHDALEHPDLDEDGRALILAEYRRVLAESRLGPEFLLDRIRRRVLEQQNANK
jgi:hypothetical protein